MQSKKEVIQLKILKIVVLLSILIFVAGCRSDESRIPYTFSAIDDIDLQIGTAKIINILDIRDMSLEAFTRTQGQLLTLFGEPIYTTPDYENAYTYVILATNVNTGQEHILTVYHGPSGPAIGGSIAIIPELAHIAEYLRQYIQQADVTDFHYVGYYLDFNLRIEKRIENGIISYSQTVIEGEELERAWRILFPELH